MTYSKMSPQSGGRQGKILAGLSKIYRQGFAYILLLPLFCLIATLVAYPLGTVGWLSLHKAKLLVGGGYQYVGLDNFISILFDERFIHSILLTSKYVSMAVSLEFLIGFGFALLLNREMKGIGLFRTFFLLPLAIMPVVVGLTYRIILNYKAGPVNYLFTLLGMEPQQWLSKSYLALLSVVIVDIWRWSPVTMLLLAAALKSLPNELYEAGRIDGGGTLTLFSHITLPLLKPVILVVLLMRLIGTYRVFDIIFMLTEGGPGTSTESISFYIFQLAFRRWQLGKAAVTSFYFLLIIIAFAVVMIKIMREKSY